MTLDSVRQRHPHKVEDLPDGEFFAILFPESTTIPGDERSRTNPGHGYPEHTVDYWRMQVYQTREEWEAEVICLGSETGAYRSKFKAIRAIPAKVKQTVSVSVE